MIIRRIAARLTTGADGCPFGVGGNNPPKNEAYLRQDNLREIHGQRHLCFAKASAAAHGNNQTMNTITIGIS